MTLNDFLLNTVYVRGGRGPREYDCWGMTRDARAALFGWALLPTCASALPGNLKEITRAVSLVSNECGMVARSSAHAGHVATAWHGALCVHVGLVVEVDARMWVLETDAPTGPCLTKLSEFEERYSKVVYYAD